MKFYLLAILVLTVQEVVSTNALLLEALHGHYALWIIHGIFVAATVFDIWIGYRIGMYTKKRLTRGKVYDFAEKMSARFNRSLGKNGRRVALLLLATFSFPYVNAFIAAWLDIPFPEAFWYLFVGNMFSYLIYWAIVLGISAAIPNFSAAVPVILAVSLAAVILYRKKRSER